MCLFKLDGLKELPSTSSWDVEKMQRKASLIVLVLSIVGFAIWSFLLGQDASWDIKNYHYYNAYALLSGRLDYDIAPAQQQTYLNPALDILPYLLAKHFPPYIFGIAIGAWQGINFWLLFLIGREIFAQIKFPRPTLWALICGLAGVTGAISVSEVGTTFHDLSLSVFILGAVYIYLREWFKVSPNTGMSLRVLLCSGFLLGIAAGLKLTFAIYGLGMVTAIVVVQIIIQKKYQVLLPFGFAALTGLLLTAGPWMWFLWKQYENPLFPMANAIFHSPYYLNQNTFDARFLPKSIWQAVSFPFHFNLSVHEGNELRFRDMREATLYVCSGLAVVYWLIKRLVDRRVDSRVVADPADHLSVLWLLILIWATYLAWIKLFSVYRYLVCIELLSPIALVALVGSIANTKAVQGFLLATLLFLIFNGKAPDWGRMPWAADFFGVHPPSSVQLSSNAVVLIASDSPLAYVIPSFPEKVRFVRIEGNFLKPSQQTALTDRIRQIIAESLDNLYLLTDSASISQSIKVTNQYLNGHTVAAESCASVSSRADSSIILCRLAPSSR